MKYHRLIFKKDDTGNCVFTEVLDQDMPDGDFEKISWDKPILKHVEDGNTHFITTNRKYLESMLLGIRVFQEVSAS